MTVQYVVSDEFAVSGPMKVTSSPYVTALTGGGFVVSWESDHGDGSGTSVKARLYDGSGESVGDTFIVETDTRGDQRHPSLTGLSDGGFVVSWTSQYGDSSGSGIKSQIYDATGSKLGGEFLANTSTRLNQDYSSLTKLANGGFLASWIDNLAVVAQFFTADGAKIGSELAITPPNGRLENYATAGLAGGGFVEVWTNDASPYNNGNYKNPTINAQVFDASGTKVGALFSMLDPVIYQKLSVTGLADGGFVLSWEDAKAIQQNSYVAQIFGANGTEKGALIPLSTHVADFGPPTLTALANGGFGVSIVENTSGGPNLTVQLYDASGAKDGDQLIVDTATREGGLASPSLAALPNGGFVVSWNEFDLNNLNTTSIHSRVYSPSVHTLFDDTGNTVDFNTKDPSSFGGVFTNSGAGDDVVTLPSSASGLAAWGLQHGFSGGDGNDVITAGPASVTMGGGNGDDILNGGAGDDVLIGGNGRDVLTGGAGHDIFRFSAAESGIGWKARDVINDFAVGQDKIDLSAVTGSSVHLVDHFTGAKGDVMMTTYHDGWVMLSLDLDGNKSADMQINVQTTGSALTANDFFHM